MAEIRRFRAHTPDFDIDLHIWLDKLATIHGHDYYEFAICNEGTILHYLNDEPVKKLKKKQAFFITPDDVHSIEATSGATHINIAFLPSIYVELCEYFGISLDKDVFLDPTITLSDAEFSQIVKLVHESFQHQHDKTAYKIALRHLLSEIFYIYARRTSEQENASANVFKCPAWLQDFVNKVCVPEHYEEPIADLYALSGYSQPIVTQAFQKYYHTSFVAYFTQKKIDYACGLLRSTNLGILDISNRIGFSSLSHFNSVFKQIVGMTPARFRKG